MKEKLLERRETSYGWELPRPAGLGRENFREILNAQWRRNDYYFAIFIKIVQILCCKNQQKEVCF